MPTAVNDMASIRCIADYLSSRAAEQELIQFVRAEAAVNRSLRPVQKQRLEFASTADCRHLPRFVVSVAARRVLGPWLVGERSSECGTALGRPYRSL
jgi:hypothetical protein